MASNFTTRIHPDELWMACMSSSYSREQQFKCKNTHIWIQMLTLIAFAKETTDQKRSFSEKYLSAIGRANANRNKMILQETI